MKAYSYIRMSTDMQRNGDSFRRQAEASRKYAEENNLEIDEEFKLTDIGVSAYNGNNIRNGALGRFYEAAKAGRVPFGSSLIVENLDRLTRQSAPLAVSLFIDILNAGINIVTLADGQVYRAGNVDMGQILMSVVIMSRAHDESMMKSHRGIANWANKRNRAQEIKLTGIAPAPFQLLPNRLSFEIVEGRDVIVQQIFELAASGVGAYSIARKLNADGVKPFGRSQRWSVSSVVKILGNRAVLGEYQPHRMENGKRVAVGDPILDYFPRIIEPDLFMRVQHARHKRAARPGGRKGRNFSNLFTGLAKCGYCGSSMRYQNKGEGPKGGRYLRCSRSLASSECVSIGWPYDAFETSFLRFAKEIDLASFVGATNHDAELRTLDEAIATEEAQIQKLETDRERTFELVANSKIGIEFLVSKLEGMELALTATRNRLAVLQEGRRDKVAEKGSFNADDKSLIDRLNAFEGEERFLQRNRLAERLRDLISSLRLWVRGTDLTADETRTLLVEALGEEVTATYDHWMREMGEKGHALPDPSFEVRFTNGIVRDLTVSRTDPTSILTGSLEDGDELYALQSDGRPESTSIIPDWRSRRVQ